MKKFKKSIAMMMAMLMVLGTIISPVFAAEDKKEDTNTMANKDKIQYLVDHDYVSGRTIEGSDKTDLALDKNITRAEVTKLLVYAQKKESLAESLKDLKGNYEDVKETHWANGFINASSGGTSRIIYGYPDKTFKPENNVTFAELVAMLTRVVDNKIDSTKISWPTTYTDAAKKLNILDGYTVSDWNKAADREGVFVLLYNTIKALDKKEAKEGPAANQYLGIVSNIVGNKIELNQDSKLRFDVTFDTIYANGINPTVGSLVRIALDGNKTVSHVVVLGTPKEGAIESSRSWAGIADKTIQTKDFKSAVADKATIGKDYVTIDGLKGIVGVNTKIFVGEKALREVRDLKSAIGDKTAVSKVYMGYNKIGNTKLAEATVIVFNAETVALPGETSVVRIKKAINNKLETEVVTTDGKTQTLDLSKVGGSPFSKDGLEENDIIELVVDKDTKKANGYNSLLVSKEAPVVTVTKIDKNMVTLKDSVGEMDFYLLNKKNVFGTLSVGAKVQIVSNKKYGETNLIDYISVVEKDATGKFDIPNREFAKEHGTLVAFNTNKDFFNGGQTKMYVNVDGTIKTYIVMNESDIAFLSDKARKVGEMIEYTTLDVQGSSTKLAYGLGLSGAKSKVAKEFEEKIMKLEDADKIVTKADAERVKPYAQQIDMGIKGARVEGQIDPILAKKLADVLAKCESLINPVKFGVKTVKGLDAEYKAVNGQKPALPEKVTLVYNDGKEVENVEVTWAAENYAVAKDQTEKTLTVKGFVKLTDGSTHEISTKVVVTRNFEIKDKLADVVVAKDGATLVEAKDVIDALPKTVTIIDRADNEEKTLDLNFTGAVTDNVVKTLNENKKVPLTIKVVKGTQTLEVTVNVARATNFAG